MKEWRTAQELAGLPGMPDTVSGVIRRNKKIVVRTRCKPRGKGIEYFVSDLPRETQAAVVANNNLREAGK